MAEHLYECVGGPMHGTRMKTHITYGTGQGFQFSLKQGYGHLDGVSYLLGLDGRMYYVDPASDVKFTVCSDNP